MIIEDLKKFNTTNGVIRITEVDNSFEDLYLKVKKKERRLYSDDEIKLLPYSSRKNPHKYEWGLRAKSYLRLKNYLSHKKTRLNILDFGCGNGWLTGQLAKEFNHNYFCIDINHFELEQAARIFSKENITFIYADIFTTSLQANTFDMVIINSALQYFENISPLLKELLFISKPYAEVHIVDTPFYNANKIVQARKKSLKYYHSIGYPEMAKKYFYHNIDELKYFRYKYLYNPNLLINRISNFIFEKDSTFPWIVLTR